MTEYNIERSEEVLTFRRTKKWLLCTLAVFLFLLVSTIIVQWMSPPYPSEKYFQFLLLPVFCFLLFVGYRLTFWGRSLIFDRKNNQFLIDGRRVCALSDLTSVQIEGSQKSSIASNMGEMRSLHLRTAQRKDITLKWAFEGHPQYGQMTDLQREISDFIRIRD